MTNILKPVAMTAILFVWYCTQRPAELQYVNAASGLVIRAGPGTDSPALTVARFGEAVHVVGETDVQQTIEGRTARWVIVEYVNHSGYAFGGFLSRSAPRVQVAASASPSGKYRYSLESAGRSSLRDCKDKYSANCDLRVFRGDTLILERPGVAPVRWLTDSKILLQLDFGDEGLGGSMLSTLDVETGVRADYCRFSELRSLERPDVAPIYEVCGETPRCFTAKADNAGSVEVRRSDNHADSILIETLSGSAVSAGFDGSDCWVAIDNVKYRAGKDSLERR